MTCCVLKMREQHCRSKTTAPSAKAMNEISQELTIDNSFVSNYTKLNGVILLTHYLWHLQIYSWQSLKALMFWIGRRLMNKTANAAQAMLPSLAVITDLFSSAPSSKQQDWLPCSTIKHTLSSSSSLLNFKTHNKTRTIDSTLCLCFHKGIWVCFNSSLQKRHFCLQ